jgi:iron(III) transport system ATP-binding protein
MSILTTSGLRKRFAGSSVDVLRDFALAIEPGEILCLVGDSGSGKTTLLRLIAGFDTPNAGRIELAGEVLCDERHFVPPEHRSVGMVFQDFALFPHFTVAANIAYGLQKLSKTDKAARVQQMLDVTHLQGLGARYPHELSGGQQQRVALARALAPQPTVLLLDEPFAALNDSLRESVRDELSSILRATGTTAVLVTHDIKDAFAVADRVAIMQEGELLQIGTPEDIYSHPKNGYVAHFFGKTNLLDAEHVDGGLKTPVGVVPANGHVVNGDAAVTVSIRPEYIELVPYEETDAPRGRVSKIKFAGQYKELTLCMDGEIRPKCHLTVYVPADTEVATDQMVRVRLRPDKIKVVN